MFKKKDHIEVLLPAQSLPSIRRIAMTIKSDHQGSYKYRKIAGLVLILGLIFLGLKLLYYPDPYLHVGDFSPVWAPDGSQIAFVSNRDGNRDENTGIYIMDANGSNITYLTPDPYKLFYIYRDDVSPAWSPDGKYIAFASAKGKRSFITDFYDPFYSYLNKVYEIYKMNVDGSNMLLLSGNNEDCLSPTWSPDGEKIAFVCSHGGHVIYVANADGTSIVRLSENGSACFSPSWSPDGKKMIFFCDQDIEDVPSIIYVIDADGSGLRELARLPFVGSVIWSPNGESILVTELDATFKRDFTKLSLMNADGTNLKQLSSEFIGGPSWSPDSSRIIYLAVDTIKIMNADGTNIQVIYDLKNDDSYVYLGNPSWSPDGSYISFYYSLVAIDGYTTDDTNSQIYLMNADGTNVIQLTHNEDEK